MNKTTLQVRIDKKTKSQAQKVFRKIGLDLSSGIKLYLRQVVNHQGIPFRVITENGFTIKAEKQMIRETEKALKDGKGYTTAKQMHDDILN